MITNNLRLNYGGVTLNDFQAQKVMEIVQDFHDKKSGGLSLHAHGAGNPLIGACVASILASEGLRVLIVAQNDFVKKTWIRNLRIIEQNQYENFELRGRKSLLENKILVGSVRSINSQIVKNKFFQQNQPDQIKFHAIIFDPAQQAATASSSELLEFFNFDFLLGLSADWKRIDGQNIADFFPGRIYGGDENSNYFSMKKMGMLSTHEGYKIPAKESLIEVFKSLDSRKQVIAFCANVEQAKRLAEEFIASGFEARAVHSGLNKHEFNRIIEEFDKGKIRILTNVSKLGEGFVSKAKLLIIARTFSSPLAEKVLIPLMVTRVLLTPGKAMILQQYVDDITDEKKLSPRGFDLDEMSGFGNRQETKTKKDVESENLQAALKIKKIKHRDEKNFADFIPNPIREHNASKGKRRIIEIERHDFLPDLDDFFAPDAPQNDLNVFYLGVSPETDIPLFEIETRDGQLIARLADDAKTVLATSSNKKELLSDVHETALNELCLLPSGVYSSPASAELLDFYVGQLKGAKPRWTDERDIKLFLLLKLLGGGGN